MLLGILLKTIQGGLIRLTTNYFYRKETQPAADTSAQQLCHYLPHAVSPSPSITSLGKQIENGSLLVFGVKS